MAQTDTARQITDFLRSLRAVRQYEPTPVPEDVVNDILEVARWSGSASNQQPGEIVVVRDRATLKALARLEGYVGHLAGAPLAMVIVMPGKWEEGEVFDEGRLSERIMLAGLAHGLGSSIGWFGDTGSNEARRLLNVPNDRRLRTAIALGYAT
ncbi:MAG TPA: nitroreductase family protein, partial [Candidatus Dormibacteraeota bacterium]|nr:nitroreductase family protein [Candidatus Dormibacteraeota bacterium]